MSCIFNEGFLLASAHQNNHSFICDYWTAICSVNYNRNMWRSNTNGLNSECSEQKCKCSIFFFFPILQFIHLRLFLSQDLFQRSLSHFGIDHIFTLSSLGLRKRGTFNFINVWSKSCLGFNPSKSWSWYAVVLVMTLSLFRRKHLQTRIFPLCVNHDPVSWLDIASALYSKWRPSETYKD